MSLKLIKKLYMKNKNLVFPLIGFMGILVFKFIIEPLGIKAATEEFVNQSYLYILTKKPNEDEGEKGGYLYQCVDLDSNSYWYKKKFSPEISSRELYNAVLVGDTIEKNKGVPFILLKRQHLVLKVPVNNDFDKTVDTVLVR